MHKFTIHARLRRLMQAHLIMRSRGSVNRNVVNPMGRKPTDSWPV